MTSSIPATIDALVTLWTTATGSTVDVRDGYTSSGDFGEPTDNIFRRVNVGVVPDTDDGVSFSRAWASNGQFRLTETFDIPCLLECVSGDEDLTSLRDAAFTLLDELAAAVGADYTLGGLVQQGAAVLGNGSLTLASSEEEGGRVGIRFVVHCETHVFDA
jgi:hypothetical protein